MEFLLEAAAEEALEAGREVEATKRSCIMALVVLLRLAEDGCWITEGRKRERFTINSVF